MELNAVFYKAQTEYNTYEKHVNAPYLRTEINAKRGYRYGLTVSGVGFLRSVRQRSKNHQGPAGAVYFKPG